MIYRAPNTRFPAPAIALIPVLRCCTDTDRHCCTTEGLGSRCGSLVTESWSIIKMRAYNLCK